MRYFAIFFHKDDLHEVREYDNKDIMLQDISTWDNYDTNNWVKYYSEIEFKKLIAHDVIGIAKKERK